MKIDTIVAFRLVKVNLSRPMKGSCGI
jgi:hypothetical protein